MNKPKNMNVILKPWKSEFFPIIAFYRKNNIEYSHVFESIEKAKNDLKFMLYDGKIYNLNFIEKGF